MDQEYYQLIDDYHHKTITNEGLIALMEWVACSDQNQQTFRDVLQAFESAEAYLLKPKNQEMNWAKIREHLEDSDHQSEKPLLRIQLKKWYTIAASVALMALLSLGYHFTHPTSSKVKLVYNEIYNPKGQKRLVTLPDGSNIYLNGDTRIWYTQNFDKGKRTVILDGEAFFDVQHKEKQPFIVKTGSINTTVLGTSFNINAYKTASKVAITVQTGKVGVVIKHPGKQNRVHFLLPNQELQVDKLTLNAVRNNTNALNSSSWREYKLVFYDKSMEEITQSIGREYDLNFEIKDSRVRHMKLTAKFDKCTVKQIMDILTELSHTTYTINENQIVIH